MFKKIFVLGLVTLVLMVGQCLAATTPVKENEQKDAVISVEETTSQLDVAESKLKVFFNSSKEKTESFRNKQAIHFATMRDEAKVNLGIQLSGEVLKDLPNIFTPPPAPTPAGTDDPKTVGDTQAKKLDSPMDYATLIFATAMASLFASVLMFYGILALIAFLLIRALFKMFA